MLYIYYGRIDELLLTGTTATTFITTRNPISILILLGLSYLMGFMATHYLKRKKHIQVITSVLAGMFLYFMSGQVIVNTLDTIQEQFLIFPIKTQKFDAVTTEFNYYGYHHRFHKREDYPCYEYCETIFFRTYQVSPYKQFIVFKGLGPLFSLENKKLGVYN